MCNHTYSCVRDERLHRLLSVLVQVNVYKRMSARPLILSGDTSLVLLLAFAFSFTILVVGFG